MTYPVTRTVLVTGATDGLGRAVAHALAADGWTVLAHGRDAAKIQTLVAALRAAGSPDARGYCADFSSLADVRSLASGVLAAESRLDVLVNNAGIISEVRQTSEDGLELAFQVNYLAAYLLSRLMLPLLERSAPARIVNVASGGQAPLDFDDPMLEQDWDAMRSYCQSKLAMITMAVEQAPALLARGITINALHPATFMPTKMVVGRFQPLHSIEAGAANTLRLIRDRELDGVTGRYFNQAVEAQANGQAYDPAAAAKLRDLSDRLCGG